MMLNLWWQPILSWALTGFLVLGSWLKRSRLRSR
jgi:hypothetical protein